MYINVYKGFDKKFLNGVNDSPLINDSIENRINVVNFTVKTKKALETALLSLDDGDIRWITYEEYSLIRDRIDMAINDYGLKVKIYVNNLLPEVYPINFEINDNLYEEIEKHIGKVLKEDMSKECANILSIFSSIYVVGDKFYGSYYNFEIDKNQINIIKAYPYNVNIIEKQSKVDLSLYINEDMISYIKEMEKIISFKPKSISVNYTNGILANRILDSLKAYCQHNKIKLYKSIECLDQNESNLDLLKEICIQDIKIPSFKEFRKIKFYKNPDISNEIIEISQAKIINEIITQAENSYDETKNHTYRDIFITASTGAGKSIMFQVPAVYLAKKYKKLTIIIEPVKALMQDQKEQLMKRGYSKVEAFNSDLITQVEKDAVLKKVHDGEIDLLYLSPETLLSYTIDRIIGKRDIGLIIIDEAHIVTTWGVGFRPDYWYLGDYINKLRNRIQTYKGKKRKIYNFPVCAFTATAINGGEDDSVSETIKSLSMENPIKYIGYAKRDNIDFDISVIEKSKMTKKDYEKSKTNIFNKRMASWIENNEKTIVYFPYASYVKDAYNGFKNFSGLKINHDKIGMYTGRNVNDASLEAFSEQKKDTFSKFKSGEMCVMFATKAFGMGVDINDIKNVYHYAVTGNLCDYVQEIGRAARKQDLKGLAIIDSYYNDSSFMETLFGMSQIKQYQINKVLSGIYSAYLTKKQNRNFLISPESFTYIFNVKGMDKTNESMCINKLKTCLLMLEKDFYDKYSVKVLISRPQSVFTKAYMVIKDEFKDVVLNSKYKNSFEFVQKGRKNEIKKDGTKVSDVGDVYSVDLEKVWEENYPTMSFPQFKYWFFQMKSTEYIKDRVEIMPEISEFIYPRQKITIETKQSLLLSELKTKIFEDIEYIGNELYGKFKKTFFTINEFTNEISSKYGASKAKVIANSLFDLVDPNHICIKPRHSEEFGKTTYFISDGTFKEIMKKSIIKSSIVNKIKDDNNSSYSAYVNLQKDEHTGVALKLLSIFEYITYEIAGGEEPEIFIRLNDPEKIRRIVTGEIKYSNNYVIRAKQKHDRDVKVLRKFFNDQLSNKDRWDYIERYFLGDDVLNLEDTVETETPLINLINIERSYQTTNMRSWNDILPYFEDNYQSIIEAIAETKCILPDYLETNLKKPLISGSIAMCWTQKNVLVVFDDITEHDRKICAAKGWKLFELMDLDPEKLFNEVM